MTLSLTNQSQQPAPAGLGWHPFFVKRARSRIAFEATGRWEMGPDKLPTQRAPSHGLDAACAFLDVDHCFDGWTGTVHLRDELLHTRVTSSLSRLVVFTNDTRDFVAIEPVSHVNNAMSLVACAAPIRRQLGLAILQPGESISAQMAIDVEQREMTAWRTAVRRARRSSANRRSGIRRSGCCIGSTSRRGRSAAPTRPRASVESWAMPRSRAASRRCAAAAW